MKIFFVFVKYHAHCEERTPTVTLALDAGKSAAVRSYCFLCVKGPVTRAQKTLIAVEKR